MNPLLTIAAISVWLNADRSLSYLAGAMIDGDGSGDNIYRDPDFQADTSLHYQGKALNAEVEKFIVVPHQVIAAVPGIVLGCKACVTNIRNGRFALAVVADVGPGDKLGEISIAVAEALGINSSPVSGGTFDHVIAYQLWPGVQAEVNGRVYDLQAAA